MKTVGFYTNGSISDVGYTETQKNGKVDCIILQRKMHIKWFVDNGWKVVMMNNRRDWKKVDKFDFMNSSNSDFVSPGKLTKHLNWGGKEDNADSLDLQKVYDSMASIANRPEWPELDLLVIENSVFPFIPIIVWKTLMMLTYRNRCPIVLIDDDNHTTQLFERTRKHLGIDLENDVIVAAHFKKQIFKKQVFFPFVYDRSMEMPIRSVLDLSHGYVYIGHDYGRRKKMQKFYFNIAPVFSKIEIFGDWSKWKGEPADQALLKGSIPIEQAHGILNRSLATCQVVLPHYEEVGQMTLRVLEASFCGCPLLADGDILGVDEYILPENIVKDGAQVTERLWVFEKQKFEQRTEMVEAQRRLLDSQFSIDKAFDALTQSGIFE